ncbi:MAG: hypothetical protein WCJ57_03940 [Candidatus Falkowbacteria bacterium]
MTDITETIFEMAALDPKKALELAKNSPKNSLPEKRLLELRDLGNYNQTSLIEQLLLEHYPKFNNLKIIIQSKDYGNKLKAKTILLEKHSKLLSKIILNDFMNDSDRDIRRKAKNVHIKRFG